LCCFIWALVCELDRGVWLLLLIEFLIGILSNMC
jgi:hypothetical protein